MRELLADDHLYAIAYYESRYRQFKEDGTPLISPTDDVGVMQINKSTWLSKAKQMGLDIEHSEIDNITMAKYIRDVQGYNAWATNKLVHQ